MRDNFPLGSCPGRNYSGATVRGEKNLGVIVQGDFNERMPRGELSGGIIWG